LIAWPDLLVQHLLQRGFRVLRFDNRDIGLSQWFDEAGVPSMGAATLRYALRLPVPAPYSLRDMASDAIGVLDALDIPRAHVCGASMGGMIAQHVARMAPARVASLTLIMTSSGSRRLPQPDWRVRQALLTRPMGRGEEAAVEWVQKLFRLIGSPLYPTPADQLKARALASVRRSWHPAGSARQLLAVAADGDRTPWLSTIAVPTRVIHGLADPLVLPACGQQLAQHIRGAQAEFIEGMGHDLPEPLLERLAHSIHLTAERGASVSPARAYPGA
ncbi:MAG: alpha/beta fold hydrolase, partial [Rubrivivax sp.]